MPAEDAPHVPEPTSPTTLSPLPYRRVNKPKPSLVRRIADNNPFYLISAACMLGGCLAITNSLSWSSIPLPRLLALIVTLNVYEFALIALGLHLIRRRNRPRDGKMLLILEAFFLVDATFLNAEIATASITWGAVLNCALFMLAVMKVLIIFNGISPAGRVLSPARVGIVLTQLGVLFVIPIALRWLDKASLSPLNLYAAWWAVGLLPAVFEVFAKVEKAAGRDPDESPMGGVAALFLALPWISLLAHVGILHYVYDVPFFGANVAPLLLGLSLVMGRWRPTGALPASELRALQFFLPLGAVLVSLSDPSRLAFHAFGSPHLLVGPMKLAVASAYLCYVYLFASSLALILIPAGAVVAAVALFGPPPARVWEMITHAAAMVWTWLNNLVRKLIPTTAAEWGLVAVTASFAFLGLGAAVSLAVSRETEKDTSAETPG